MNKHLSFIHLLLLSTTILIIFQLTSAVDFLFNGFGPSDVSRYGDSTNISRAITLTNRLPFSLGRAIYPSKIPTKQPSSSFVLPFSTSFIFAMSPYRSELPGHGLMFVFVPTPGIQESSSAQHLGLFNSTNNGSPDNHVFGVEFDVFRNEEFGDMNDNHVGIDVNSLFSVNASESGYWPDNGGSFRKLDLNSGSNYQVWIDYVDGFVNVTIAPVGFMNRPNRPLISFPINLSDVLEDEMYVGFAAATGALTQSHLILAWSFSNTNFSLSDGFITRGLPNFGPPKTPIHRTKGFIAGSISLGFLFLVVVALLLVIMNKRIKKKREGLMEDWELEYWPHRISYRKIESATNNFSEDNVIGVGGNGKVYRGVFTGGSEVAVKRISRESSEGIKAFSAEISSIGRLKHRNLVRLRGWCKKDKSSLVLVYDYMENGSLDKRVFDCDENKVLNFEDRIRILKQVASGILYLHHGWEFKVVHRDIKASNVLLDKEMNARLGDFGLARVDDNDDKVDNGPTRVVGTIGYLAPEVVRSGIASTETDVFSYGILILEVICGRRPIEQGEPLLVEWLWELLRKGELISGVDPRLRTNGVFDEEKVEKMLHLGLLCAHPDPSLRPTMRQVMKMFEEKTEEVDEDEGDEDVYILEKMKSQEILCSLVSISWSDSIGVGR
ncbi:L-type lectin-domain containing receptor kinase VII.1 [Castilleja foliolosa]|uniref:non-specific serine/threonine protein kinase n=1 Tax=Castilleja foliolosa TaxID=1961234 RepID=A0ABD3CD36_9LAMI